MHLDQGEHITVSVSARQYWTNSSIDVKAGEQYALRALGTWEDGPKSCGPDGYECALLAPLQRMRRVPEANWNSLIGSLDKRKESEFVIATATTLVCREPGRLYAFANDAPFMYWNNRGTLRLSITRLSDG